MAVDVPVGRGECVPGSGGVDLGKCLLLNQSATVQDTYGTPAALVNTIIPNLFIFGGITIFFVLIYAGFKYISGSTKGKDDAKQIITTAIAGLIIMLSAYWILQIIRALTGADVGL